MFDRYYDDSIKNLNKFHCDTGLSRVYHVILGLPIHSKDVMLKVSENKEQLIKYILNELVANAMVIFPQKKTDTGKDTLLL